MKYIFSLLVVLTLFSCEETMVVIPFDEAPIVTSRTVLIEELTGVQCPNCPKGAAAVEAISERFGENVYVIAVHGKALADPIPGESKYDFRNPDAANLEDFHLPFLGKPAALFNRRFFDNELFTPVDNIDIWQSLVEQELERDSTMAIELTHTFNPNTRRIDLTATVIPIIDLPGEYRISVFVTQSDIVDAQENQGIIIEEYTHKHILRHMMTSFDGDQLANDLVAESEIVKNFSYTIPDEYYEITQKFEVVVCVHFNSTNDKHVEHTAGFKINE